MLLISLSTSPSPGVSGPSTLASQAASLALCGAGILHSAQVSLCSWHIETQAASQPRAPSHNKQHEPFITLKNIFIIIFSSLQKQSHTILLSTHHQGMVGLGTEPASPRPCPAEQMAAWAVGTSLLAIRTSVPDRKC